MAAWFHRFVLAAGVVASLTLPVATRATEALSFTGGTVTFSAMTRGFAFSLAHAVTITGLGWWDQGADGLHVDHDVSIWSFTGTQLVSGTVASGTDAALVDGFRYTGTLTGSLSLNAGTYVIGGLSVPKDQVVDGVLPGDLTTAIGVTFIENRNNFDTGVYSFPGHPQANIDIGMFGPNFQFDTVPEPSTWLLLIAGFAATGVAVRRRRIAAA